jgi:hypothetical protein
MPLILFFKRGKVYFWLTVFSFFGGGSWEGGKTGSGYIAQAGLEHTIWLFFFFL